MVSTKKRFMRGLFAFATLILVCALVLGDAPTWSPEIQLTTDLGTDWNPSVTQSIQDANRTIWVVWASNRYGGNFNIFYKTSTDGGATWSAETQLTTDPSTDDSPSITQTMDGKIWVAWHSSRTGNYTIFYKTSTDGGASWANDTQLTTSMGYNMNPSIIHTADGKILVVWQSDRIWAWDPVAGEDIPQDDLFYKTSTDGGATWSAETQLTTDTKDDVLPSITQTSDGTIWVVWASNRYGGNFNIFHKTSTDGGATWSAETQLTTHLSGDWRPSVTQSSDRSIWVVWHSQRDSNCDVYYKTSSDGGSTWSAEAQLTTDAEVDTVPSIYQAIQGTNGTIWVVWASNRTGNYDIFYKTSDIGVVHDVTVISVTPSSTEVYTAWASLDIEVIVGNTGTVAENFTITAQIGNTSLGTKTVTNLAPRAKKTLTFTWSLSGVSVGTYGPLFTNASVVSGETYTIDNTKIDGSVRVKGPGDANGNNIVNILDVNDLLFAWQTSPQQPVVVDPFTGTVYNWNLQCDFNGDDKINIQDLNTIILNWQNHY